MGRYIRENVYDDALLEALDEEASYYQDHAETKQKRAERRQRKDNRRENKLDKEWADDRDY